MLIALLEREPGVRSVCDRSTNDDRGSPTVTYQSGLSAVDIGIRSQHHPPHQRCPPLRYRTSTTVRETARSISDTPLRFVLFDHQECEIVCKMGYSVICSNGQTAVGIIIRYFLTHPMTYFKVTDLIILTKQRGH